MTTEAQRLAMIAIVDNATREVRRAREKAFTTREEIAGPQFRAIEEALRHLEEARIAIRGVI